EKAALTAQNEKSIGALNKQLAQLEEEKASLTEQNSLLMKNSSLSKEEKAKLQKAQAEQTALLEKNQAAEAALKAQIAALTENSTPQQPLPPLRRKKSRPWPQSLPA
ncbi:hypothetical protein CSE899_17642, partial [Cronobacter sakazakii E899]